MSLKERIEVIVVALCKMLGIGILKRTAGVVIEKDGKFLLVQEKMSIPGIFGKWNLPMGRTEKKESDQSCALREGEEETGYVLKLGSFICNYAFEVCPIEMLVSVYEAEIIGGELKVPSDLLDVKYFSFEEIKRLNMEGKLIEPYVLCAVEAYKTIKKTEE